jgi:hypothetical protein
VWRRVYARNSRNGSRRPVGLGKSGG